MWAFNSASMTTKATRLLRPRRRCVETNQTSLDHCSSLQRGVVDAAEQILDATPVRRTGQLEATQPHATAGRALLAVHHEVIEDRTEDREEDDARHPDPFAAADGVEFKNGLTLVS
jgi:hypothetical protein